MDLHEFSDEEVSRELKMKEAHMQRYTNTIIRLKAEHFIKEADVEGKAAEKEGVVTLKIPPKRIRKDLFLVGVKRKLCEHNKAHEDAVFSSGSLELHTKNLSEAERKELIAADMLSYEGIYKIDSFLLKSKAENSFFAFEPLTLKEICEAEVIDWKESLHIIYISLVFVLTFERLGSGIYTHAKAALSLLESLSLVVGYRDFFDELTAEKKQGLVGFIDSIASRNISLAFLDDVDYKRLRLVKYVDIIRQPLSLLKIKEKLLRDRYLNYFVAVSELKGVFINCMVFNHKDSEIFLSALTLLKELKSFLGEETSEKTSGFLEFLFCNNLKPAEKKNLNSTFLTILATVEEIRESQLFVNKTTYASKVRRNMYFEKMRKKAVIDAYISLGHFLEDFKVMISNCMAYGSAQQIKACRVVHKKFREVLVLYFGENVARISLG